MSSTAIRRVTVVSLSAALAAGALVGGIALGSDDDAAATTVTTAGSQATAPRGTPPSTSPPSTTPAAASGAARGPSAAPRKSTKATVSAAALKASASSALLEAGQMPRVNQVQRWSATAGEGTFVAFKSTDYVGVADAARRDFRLPGGRAANVVLTFSDEASAGRAFRSVVGASKPDLEAGLPAGGALLFGPGNAVPVKVSAGQASFIALVYKDDPTSDEGWFEWVGATRRGTAVSFVVWRVGGQDASYAVDPTIATLRAANDALRKRS